MNKQEKKSFWGRPAVQSITASLLCIVLGLLIGFIVLLIIVVVLCIACFSTLKAIKQRLYFISSANNDRYK